MTLTHGELFAGISGFGVGFEASGIVTRWRVEIDNAARSVLRHHYPADHLERDVKECGAHNLEPVDIVTFGSPCQDLSVAGKRAGLGGQRSGLFHEAIRIVSELRPALAIWENVPGAFSSNAGRDFAAVLTAFRDIGARDIGWTVLDAQYSGVAQRRRRVFVVADFRGDRAGEILFESPCVCGNPPPSREAGTGVAALTSHGVGTCGADDNQGQAGHLIPSTTDVSHCLNAGGMGRQDYETETLIAHTLRAEGYDGCEDGTGRGTPIVATGFHSRQDPISEAEMSLLLEAKAGQAVCFTIHGTDKTANVASETELAGSIRTKAPGSIENSSTTVALCFQTRIARNGRGQPKDVADALTSSEGGTHADSKPHVAGSFGVRRLTPRECERLQGFPDDWTRYGVNEKGKAVELADGPRYKCLGNAVATVTAKWIGKQIAKVLT